MRDQGSNNQASKRRKLKEKRENGAGKNSADERFLALSRSEGQMVANCSHPAGQIISWKKICETSFGKECFPSYVRPPIFKVNGHYWPVVNYPDRGNCDKGQFLTCELRG